LATVTTCVSNLPGAVALHPPSAAMLKIRNHTDPIRIFTPPRES
jgi:hypothetical protein